MSRGPAVIYAEIARERTVDYRLVKRYLPMDPRNVLRTIRRFDQRVGMTRQVGVHSPRHSAATAMIELGANLKAIAGRWIRSHRP